MTPFASRLDKLATYSFLSVGVVGLGFVRELVVAAHYGISAELDAYAAVFGIYTLLGTQSAAASEAVFISKTASITDKKKSALEVARYLRGIAILNLFAVTITVGVFNLLLSFVFPDFTNHMIDGATVCLAGMLLAACMTSLSGPLRGALANMGRFSMTFATGGIVSIGAIVSVVIFSDILGTFALPLGYIGGSAAALFVATIALRGRISSPQRTTQIGLSFFSHTKWLLSTIGIVLLAEALLQASMVVERGFMSRFGEGSVSAFFYASSLTAMPTALLVNPIVTVLYPKLVRSFSEDVISARRFLMRISLVLVVGVLIFTLVLAIFSEALVEAVFVRGEFGLDDAERTAEIFQILVWTLPFRSISRLLRNAAFSVSNYNISVLTQVIRIGTFISLVFVYGPSNVTAIAHFSLMSIAVSVLATAALISRLLRKAQH